MVSNTTVLVCYKGKCHISMSGGHRLIIGFEEAGKEIDLIQDVGKNK
jgi:hypothetical protein